MSESNLINDTVPVYEILINDQFITAADMEKVHLFSKKSGISLIKILLTFGYISRKNYERSLTNFGYVFHEDVRQEPIDTDIIALLDLKHISNVLALPLRIENDKVVTLMADPTDHEFINFVYETYGLEPEIVLASDLDITWMSHKLLGEAYLKASVFELMKSDPANSAVITFSPKQLYALFGAIAIVVSFLF